MGGCVPEDFSLVGIDDSSLTANCEVPLTSVKYPKQRLGKKAAPKGLRSPCQFQCKKARMRLPHAGFFCNVALMP
ncbi:substrate-binding domain-containing protein [Paenibacillus kobensis]|uniref:substrate-binding domain-containing protein n=1 Tax=Paenibacillus kobensis TaxID=59841 RepID=UPI002482ACFA|nr:substrate-binding domain-containing protein [Paenibacillus kobensis]